ncbi:MAG: Secreted deoxyriboendonuclease [Parcubacteria group bacterium Athens0416_74]|nr:MAG: Secreted deoxyriboendonuclease [Parcubacteria group bacterium Athens0416_74]
MQRILLLLAVLIALASGAYFIWGTSSPVEYVQSATSTPTSVRTTVKESNENTAAYTIDVKYPQFGIPSADAVIKGYVERAIAAFKSYPSDVPSVDSVPKNEQVISFEDAYAGSDFVSVALLVSEYTGGAHPNSVYIGVNVDVRTGKEVTLGEALALTGKSLAQVAAQTDKEMKAKLTDAYFKEGAEAKAENYSTFTISKDSVTFIFNSYQVGPYAAGPQEVSFARVK